ncbi:hypothetical protein MMC30_008752 [Trapelia coarctata]|nr:hypothetical protein [Trapelia coarctata]
MTRNLFSLKALLVLAAGCSAAAISSQKVDYVIVGGGPAGFVLAERLSRNASVKVALLEAGPDNQTDPLVEVPAYFFQTQQYMWQYNSEPDPNLGGLTPNLWQGKRWGGGTGVNAMLYCRGAASVFDEWAEVSGNDGLAWASILQDFKQTTHYADPHVNYTQVVNTSVLGNGPLEVTRDRQLTEFDEPFANALKSTLNLTEIDMIDGHAIGVSLGLETIRESNRTRDYALNTFGYLMASRPNVQMLHSAWVQRIGFSDKTAQSITYINSLSNKTYKINAKEIIVTAGALNSVQLLMLSGVGPKDTLSKLNIPVVADIPGIGAQLYDHHYSVAEYQTVDSVESFWQWSENATEIPIARAQYAANGDGPLGRINGDVYAGLRLPDSVFEAINNSYYPSIPKDRPQVIYEFASTPFLQGAPNVSIIGTLVAVIQPEAYGYVTINSSDYRDPPLIYSNFYGSEGDKAAVLYGYKQLRSIMLSDALKPYIVNEIFPGPNVKTDEQIWKSIQTGAESWHHAMGTIAIGKVLDTNWRIKGLKGIRVVGSAAFPSPPTCAIQATTYALAHRAAKDIVKADANCA